MKNTTLDYQGPMKIHEDVQLALDNLNSLLSVQIRQNDNHCVIQIDGLDHRDEVVQGVAVYLVGAIASCIDFNLAIRKALFTEQTLTRDLFRDVVSVIGQNNDIGDNCKTYERNPWIWEGICHLLFHLSEKNGANHPPDCLLAKSSVHLDVKDHGLDVIALYGNEYLGVTAGECKAYLDRPSDAIRDAANRLQEVDMDLRDAEIRSTLSQFRPSLSPEKQNMMVGTFWHRERAYFPMVCCDSRHSVIWTANRVVLTRLKPPANRKYLVPASIQDAVTFFDAVSEAMRQYVSGKI